MRDPYTVLSRLTDRTPFGNSGHSPPLLPNPRRTWPDESTRNPYLGVHEPFD